MKVPFAIASNSMPEFASATAIMPRASAKDPHVCERTVEDLLRLHDGDQGVVKLITMGPSVIPAVSKFLFRRNRAGLYQPRCWAVEVLAALGAADVLKAYLRAANPAASDVERFGNEAVVNAAARALGNSRQSGVFEFLLMIARDRPYPGVLEALGSFARKESIPLLIDALAEDDCRAIAETALELLRPAAEGHLWDALQRLPARPLYETARRQRRSILRLLNRRV